MPGPAEADLRRTLGCGELVGLVYRLGRHAASGVLTLTVPTARPEPRPEVFVLRRGAALCAEGELGRRAVSARLARAAAEPSQWATFEGGVAASPPGAVNQLSLAGWARSHVEGRFDGALAEALVRDLGGRRLALRPELAPDPADDADRRMLAAMTQPRRLDQIWPLARTPRYRMLAFLHMLRSLGALDIDAPTQSSHARASTTGTTSASTNASRVVPTGGSTNASRSGSTGGSTNASRSGSTGASTNASRSGSTGGSTNASRSGSTGGSTNASRSGSTGGSTNASRSGSTGGSTNAWREPTGGSRSASASGVNLRARSADIRRAAAMRVLGLEVSADADDVKRAYRRLARTLHPDLQPGADEERRRLLERRFAELTAAYEALV